MTAQTSSFNVPALTGHYTNLRPVAPSDHDWMYRTAISQPVSPHWRFHGLVPTFEQFMRVVHAGEELTFVATDLSGERLGMVQLISFNERHQYGYLSLFFDGSVQGKAWALESLALFLRYVFRCFGLRKIYLQSLRPTIDFYRTMIGDVLVEEGCLVDHEIVAGEYHDMLTFALYRKTWMELEDDYLD